MPVLLEARLPDPLSILSLLAALLRVLHSRLATSLLIDDDIH